MEIVKTVHVYSAYITGLVFLIRGILAILQSAMLRHQVLKTLPHFIDTVLFVSGLTMVVAWAIWPSTNAWLFAKLVALLFYILFGLVMLRWGSSARNRWLGLLGGLLVYLYIVGVAHGKSVMPLFSFM
jgi:uncharacterized membrane protein SirB2